MAGIAKNITDGAMSFLKAEYSILFVFVLAVGALSRVMELLLKEKHPIAFDCSFIWFGCIVLRTGRNLSV